MIPVKPKLFAEFADTPKCSPAHLFIHDALQVAGKAIFGENWTGKELGVVDWPTSPDTAWQEERRQASLLRLAPRPAARIVRSGRPAPQTDKVQHSAHVLEWHRYQHRKTEMAAWTENQEALQRAREAADWLHLKFREESIATATRLTGAPGEPQEMPPSQWYCENAFEKRFLPGRYDRWLPGATKSLPVYIFVDRGQLEKAASTLPHAEAIISDTDLSACSPFLRFAVGFSLKHGDLINQWGQESVQEQIKDEWDAANPSDPMSKKMAERMSYVVRVHDPAAIAIGATASAGRKRGSTPGS